MSEVFQEGALKAISSTNQILEISKLLKRIIERLEKLEYEIEKLKNPEGQSER